MDTPLPDSCWNWCSRGAYARDTYAQMHGEGVEPADDYSDCPSLHAEQNALMFSDRRLREGGTIYVSSAVCGICAKLIANSGLVQVVTPKLTEERAYRNGEKWVRFMESCGVTVVEV